MADTIQLADFYFPTRRNNFVGPWNREGSLWAFGLVGPSGDLITADTVGRFVQVAKSTDLGQTWAYATQSAGRVLFTYGTAGAEQFQPGRYALASLGRDGRSFAVGDDPAFPMVLVAFWVADQATAEAPPEPQNLSPEFANFHIVPFDCEFEEWQFGGGKGPRICPNAVATPGYENGTGWYAYQAYKAISVVPSSGYAYPLAVMDYDTATPLTNPPTFAARVYYAQVTDYYANWDGVTPDRVPNQVLNPAVASPAHYYPLTSINGSGDRIHAFIAMVKDGVGDEPAGVCHFFVDDGTGNPGSEVTQVTASGEIWPVDQDQDGGTVGFDAATFDAGGGDTGIAFVYGVESGGNITRKLAYCLDDTNPVWVHVTIDTVPLESEYPSSWGVGRNTLASELVFRYGLGATSGDTNQLAQRTFDGLTQELGEELIAMEGTAGSLWFRQASVGAIASVGSIAGSTSGTNPLGVSSLPMFAWFSGPGNPVPPPVPGTTTVITPPPYGAMIVVKCANYYDHCLYGEREAGRWLRRLALERLNPAKNSDKLSKQSPYTILPFDGVEFRKQAAISLPGTEEVDTVILRWRVPTGYDGVIWGLTTMFTGSGYFEGSGDIIYRVKINNRWMKDLGAINNTMGSLQQTFPFTEHERIYSQQTISVYAYLGSGALGRLNPAGKLIAAMDGWIYNNCQKQERF